MPLRRTALPILFLACSLLVSSALGASTVRAEAAPGAAAATSTTQSRLVWGAFARPRGSENLRTALEHLEAKSGRQVAATRVYLKWNSGLGSYQQWLVSTGRVPLISVTSTRLDGSTVPWSSIAGASSSSAIGKQIAAWADGVKALKGKVYFTFNHEPEAAASNKRGSSQDFIAAWRKIVSVFRQRGVTNAKLLLIMTDWSYAVNGGDRRAAAKWYPGDSYVDAIGSDVYNVHNCRTDFKTGWRPLATQIEAFRQFGLAHPGKELWLPEFGSVEDGSQPGRKAAWLNEAKAAFKSDKYAQFRGMVYFHALREGTPCSWWLDSSSSAVSAWAAMGKDTFYRRTS